MNTSFLKHFIKDTTVQALYFEIKNQPTPIFQLSFISNAIFMTYRKRLLNGTCLLTNFLGWITYSPAL